jgi:hypothetical protein
MEYKEALFLDIQVGLGVGGFLHQSSTIVATKIHMCHACILQTAKNKNKEELEIVNS